MCNLSCAIIRPEAVSQLPMTWVAALRRHWISCSLCYSARRKTFASHPAQSPAPVEMHDPMATPISLQ